MSRERWGSVAVVLMVAFGSAAASPRQRSPPTKAEQHFERGVEQFEQHEYAAALAEFETAFSLDARPEILFAICHAEKSLFRWAEAMDCLERYVERKPKIEAQRQAALDQMRAEMKALLVEATIDVTPENAQIRIDGERPVARPNRPLLLAVGGRKIEVSADGYNSVQQEIDVVADTPIHLVFALEPVPRSGRARITTSVLRSLVAIDDKPIGLAPVKVELPIAGHTLVVTAPGYRRHQGELAILGGEERLVHIVLEREAPETVPLYKQWWLWTAGGVVVAGAAALTIGLLWPGSGSCPQSGTLSDLCQNVDPKQ